MNDLIIKAILNQDDARKFGAIMEYYGIKARSEGVRICINNCYKELAKQNPDCVKACEGCGDPAE